jgi:hypothetical protein
MRCSTNHDLLLHAGDVCRYANRSSRKMFVTLPDFSQRSNGSTLSRKILLYRFIPHFMKYNTRTDGHVEEKNDVNRCCAVEEKRVKNK